MVCVGRVAAIFAVAATLAACGDAGPQGPVVSTAPGGDGWHQRVVFYQVFVRSFQDSDADGIGDLRGLISRLDYIAGLGVGAIWLMPVYPSPLADSGYDVADEERDSGSLLRHYRGLIALRNATPAL
jgi:pullulanase/glycogen debranching enzyme